MGLFSKDIKSMDDLFVHTLRDIYYAEKQIVKALPEMVEKASNPQLKQGFQSHLRETERLDQVFKSLGQKAQGVDCPATALSRKPRRWPAKSTTSPCLTPR